MTDVKTHLASCGIAMTIVGVSLLYWFSPLNEWQIDGGTVDTDSRQLEKEAKRKNHLMRVGVFLVVAGSAIQILANYWPQAVASSMG